MEQDQESQNPITLEKRDRMNTKEELCGPSFLDIRSRIILLCSSITLRLFAGAGGSERVEK